jgi:Holliday junction resolvasome RuvABC endonuclease subunit
MAKKKAVKPAKPAFDISWAPELILGLDMSLGKPGWAVYCCTTGCVQSGFWDIEKLQLKGMERIQWIDSEVYSLLEGIHEGQHGHVFIEGYSFGSKGSSGISLGELGGVIRFSIHCRTNWRLHEVSPSTLKKFISGKSGAPKEIMLKELNKRYGYDRSGSDPELHILNDEGDALGLMELGRALYSKNTKPLVQFQRDAISIF